MTRKKPDVQPKPFEPEADVVGRFMLGREGRALPFAADEDRSDIVWATPANKSRLLVSVRCDRCHGPMGAVFRQGYTDGSDGLLCHAGRVVEVDPEVKIDVTFVRLDREVEPDRIRFDCWNVGHGSADISVEVLRTWAASTSGKQRRRHAARPLVQDVRCSIMYRSP